MNTKTQAQIVLQRLKKRYPQTRSKLAWSNAWELLVSTVLAAQCTDERVNRVTPVFFERWPDAAALAGAEIEEVQEVIRSTGFFRNKARNLVLAARRIQDAYNSRVPRTMEGLVSLPGVARKTANIVLSNAFGIQEGLAVDTHVKRLSYRLGLTGHTDPNKIEKDLMLLFPRQEWGEVNHLLVFFGRDVCTARSPKCPACELNDICPRRGVK